MNIDNIRPKTPKLKAETVKPRKKYKQPPPSPSSLNLLKYDISVNPGLTRIELSKVSSLSLRTIHRCLPILFYNGEITKEFVKKAGPHDVYKFYYIGKPI